MTKYLKTKLISDNTKESDQMKILNSQLTQKLVEIGDINQKVNNLTQSLSTNSSNLNQLNSQISNMKGSLGVMASSIKINTTFTTYDSNFTTSNNGKTIERNSNSTSSWNGVMCGNNVAFNGSIFEFTIRIDGTR